MCLKCKACTHSYSMKCIVSCHLYVDLAGICLFSNILSFLTIEKDEMNSNTELLVDKLEFTNVLFTIYQLLLICTG